MEFYIPKSLSSDIRKQLGFAKVEKVKVVVEPKAIIDECLSNVRDYLIKNHGEIQFGWKFSVLGNVLLRAVGHAVLKTSDGKLTCITPNNTNLNKINFLPDNSIKNKIITNYLPCKHMSLIDNEDVIAYASLMDQYEQIKLYFPVEKHSEEKIKLEKQANEFIFKLQYAAIQKTKMDDYCFCGSNLIRAFCCQ